MLKLTHTDITAKETRKARIGKETQKKIKVIIKKYTSLNKEANTEQYNEFNQEIKTPLQK